MLESYSIAVIAGITLGFLAGIGVGGGSLLILWLTLVLHLDLNTARIINLLFFIPTAVIASFFRKKQKTLHLKKLLPAMIAGCLSAAIFTILGKNLDVSLLRKLFGILLLITGIRELLYRPRKAK